MPNTPPAPLVDWDVYRAARTEMGPGFVRLLGYFREDGMTAVAALEEAMRARDAVRLIEPASRLMEEAAQFGAEQLADEGEAIELFARQCIEHQVPPDEYLPRIVKLRGLFNRTLEELEREANPLVQRRPTMSPSLAALRSYG